MRRYDGNTGRYIYIPDEPVPTPASAPEPRREEAEPVRQMPQNKTPPPNSFGSGLQNLLSGIFSQGFEVEDLLLFAVLFLMYQETKDKELLIIMGGMFLL